MPAFRNATGQLILQSLFIEYKYSREYALYTLDTQDKVSGGVTYPSLYKLYMAMSDVTEYHFANKFFESYQHWDMLCKEDFFKKHIFQWRKELELKIKSEALKEIIDQASSENPNKRMEAAKYLYEKVFVGDKTTKGRPSKAEIKRQAQQQLEEANLLEEHRKAVLVN